MITFKRAFTNVLLTAALGLGSNMVLASSPAEASIPFNPPTSGAPTGRGGASRGDQACSSNPVEFSRRFLSFAPANSNYGLTLRPRPTLFAYVPPSPASKVFFSLKDESGKTHYQTTLPISKSGILKIQIPESVRPLEVSKRYVWGVAVLCSGTLTPNSPFVTSWIQRIEPSAALQTGLHKAASLEQATLYGINGIWYDTLTTLVTLQKQQPQNTQLRTAWSDLLISVGLGAVATESVVN
jgi:Domain of Unknown Function (DUF928)